ncbi:hypothetical protein ACI8AC_21730 [Geodermatophilus sp. SYSU D00758]
MSESEHGSHAPGADAEIDDPGRDPKGLTPPRNPMSGGFGNAAGGPDQDTGQGRPEGTGNVGPADKPEAPTDRPETRADTPDRP